MSFRSAKESLARDLAEIKEAGLWKTERVIAKPEMFESHLYESSLPSGSLLPFAENSNAIS